jgi:hypothetical protein
MARWRAARPATQELYRGSISPLEVLHNQEDRALPALALPELLHRKKELALELFGIEVFEALLRLLEAQQGLYHRNDRLGWGATGG